MYYIYAVICHKLTNPLIYTVKNLARHEKNLILIHVDKKLNDKDFLEIKKIFINLKNVLFIEDRIDVRWGSISQIDVMLCLLRQARKYNFKYISLISGDDIVLWKNQDIINFLNECYLKKIQFIGAEKNCENYYNRININHLNIMYKKDRSLFVNIICKIYNKYNRLFNKKKLHNFPKLYKGSCWFTITDDAVNYIFSYLENNKNYYNFFKNSFCADEIFFQTIIFNSYFIKNISFHDDDGIMALRYIDWYSGPDYPRTLDESDFDKIKESKMLFARKFNCNQDLNKIDIFFND